MSSDFNPNKAPPAPMSLTTNTPRPSQFKILTKFRGESHALAGMAIFADVLTGLIGFAAVSSLAVLLPMFVSSSLIMIGGQIAGKKMTAVRIFTAYLCLGLFGFLLFFVSMPPPAVFGVIVCALSVALCHRVFACSRQLLSAGISLNLPPKMFTATKPANPEVFGGSITIDGAAAHDSSHRPAFPAI